MFKSMLHFLQKSLFRLSNIRIILFCKNFKDLIQYIKNYKILNKIKNNLITQNKNFIFVHIYKLYKLYNKKHTNFS